MKRSMTVSLVLLGSAAVSLSGCKPKAESFASVAACEDSGRHTHEECVDAFTAAKSEYEAKAQHYKTREECVATYGADAALRPMRSRRGRADHDQPGALHPALYSRLNRSGVKP